jgi:hypothetical protein
MEFRNAFRGAATGVGSEAVAVEVVGGLSATLVNVGTEVGAGETGLVAFLMGRILP